MSTPGLNSIGIPVLVVTSPSQAGLAAGAELFLQITPPLGLLIPAPSPGNPALLVQMTVSANDTPNASLVVTSNLNNGGLLQCRVRNVGTVTSGSWSVSAIVFGPGQAPGSL